MTDTPESIKIKMLADAGFHPIPLQEKYLKLVDFVKNIHGCPYGQDCHEQYKEAQELLKEIGEIEWKK